MQGERLALASDDVDGWIRRFESYPKVQLIDLDAAKGEGVNEALIQRICAALPCQVGGGIRSVERAHEILALGAQRIIVGSSFFINHGIDTSFAQELSSRLGPDRVIAAIDSRDGRVVIHGWRTRLDISPADAVRELEPYVGGFLYTIVDREGLMQGTDLGAIRAIRQSTTRAVIAAGGITTLDEVNLLHSIGVDAVVGMALYTGRLNPERR